MPADDIASPLPVFETHTAYAYNQPPVRARRLDWMDAFFKNLTRFFAFFVFSILASIPRRIYGRWGLFRCAPLFAEYVQPALIRAFGPPPILGPLFKGPAMGIGMLTSGIILAVMVIPFITAVMRDVFELVPPMLKESAYGLGATTWEVVWRIVLPYTKIGVVGGVMLGLGRALGETMAVTFVIGNAHRLSMSLMAPGN